MKGSGIDPVSRLVLDTSAFSRLRSGHPLVMALIAASEAVFVPVTVLGELEAGFQLGRRLRENRIALADFLSEPFVSVLTAMPETARRYGELFARLKQAGTPVPVNDIWIGAATLECGGHLITFDHHFQKFEHLPCTIVSIDDAPPKTGR